MNARNYYWTLADGRIWGATEARWLDAADVPPGETIIPLIRNGQPADEAYLLETVRFYGCEPGELGTVADVRTRSLNRLAIAFETASAALLGADPPTATATWPIQQAEAEAFRSDANASTPLLDGLAQARGLDKAELVARVLKKAALFKAASGVLLGQQQALRDRIDAIVTGDGDEAAKKAALLALDITLALPPAEVA